MCNHRHLHYFRDQTDRVVKIVCISCGAIGFPSARESVLRLAEQVVERYGWRTMAKILSKMKIGETAFVTVESFDRERGLIDLSRTGNRWSEAGRHCVPIQRVEEDGWILIGSNEGILRPYKPQRRPSNAI